MSAKFSCEGILNNRKPLRVKVFIKYKILIDKDKKPTINLKKNENENKFDSRHC